MPNGVTEPASRPQLSQLRLAEGIDPARGADHAGDRLQIDRRVAFRRDQEIGLLVLEERKLFLNGRRGWPP